MSASIPVTIRPTDCCATGCDSAVTTEVPGPAGAPGAPGADGTDGSNAFTTTTAQYTQPAVGNNVTIAVTDSTWAAIGQPVFVSVGGSYTVASIPDATHLQITNLGYSGNAAPAAIVATSQQVSPSGVKGDTGSSGAATLNGISPTTTKGDIIVDNGANSPSASDVRLGVGTNGQIMTANSGQPTGLQWQSVVPNTVTADNTVPRYNGASGTPVPLQDSKVTITDNGAIRADGSGGNARGTDAIDLQVTRVANTQVASGTNSVIGGGANNTASALESTVCGGGDNVASASESFVGGGDTNTASGGASVVCGGDNNTSSAQNATIGGGSGNTAAGINSTVCGGIQNEANGRNSVVIGGQGANANLFGSVAFTSLFFVDIGDAQAMDLVWTRATTDATANREMFLDGSTQRASIISGTTWFFDIMLVGRSDAGVSACWTAKGLITNNAGTTAMTCAATIASVCDGTGGSWGVVGSFVVSADNANDALHLDVTGAALTPIRWVAHGRLVQVQF